ncbi:MAG: hypothetical protein KF764_25670 [Labilithrix sp.]|nr:hypothetical protein [Labilithrix sp.]MBX3225430.1 hypothetical protein [Labilithrix sp.]
MASGPPGEVRAGSDAWACADGAGRRGQARLARSALGVALGAGALLVAGAIGCGGGDSGVANAKLPDGVRSQTIEHEACSESGHRVETVDVNNDGKPDIRRVFDGDAEICRISDLNRDGKPDLFEYYDKTGQLRRREADYDDNGIVNAIEIYENGKLVRAELDTTNQGRIDTWDTFDPATGKRIKRERDATGDGRIDQWWTYNGDQVTIAMDKNGDGLPDPDATITLGASGTAIQPPTAAEDAGAASTPVAAPTPEPSPSPSPSPELSPTTGDAGAPTPPKRGGAKR